ncbi:hypothetical protein E8E13_007777 [Curvularia kusanoi]|uniref:Uncharacterized protein n=1 Tax=Curvularia kusanoi TaxID=90978 RepID=A0A9P4TAK9_CURKU|nr:hypothetical protein E8E13_007777 [Curvularia kusanoi]
MWLQPDHKSSKIDVYESKIFVHTSAWPLDHRQEQSLAPELLSTISELNTAVTDLTTAVNTFDGSLLGLIPQSFAVVSAEAKLDIEILKATYIAKQSANFTTEESGSIVISDFQEDAHGPNCQLFVRNIPQQFVDHVVALFSVHDPVETKNYFPGMPSTTIMIAMPNKEIAAEAYNSLNGMTVGGQELVIEQYSDDMPSAAVRDAYIKNRRRLRRSIEGRRIIEEDEDEDVEDVGAIKAVKDHQRRSSPPLIFGLHRPLPINLSLDSPLNFDDLRRFYEPYRTNNPGKSTAFDDYTATPPESHLPSTGVGDFNLLQPKPISPGRAPKFLNRDEPEFTKFLKRSEPEFIKPPPGFGSLASAPSTHPLRSNPPLPIGHGKAYKIVHPPPGFGDQPPRIISPSPAFVLPAYTGENTVHGADVRDAAEPQQKTYSTVPWNGTVVPTGTAYYEAMQTKGMGSRWSSDSSSAYSQGSTTPRQGPVRPAQPIEPIGSGRGKEGRMYEFVDPAKELSYRHERNCLWCKEQRKKREENWTEKNERMEVWRASNGA